MIHEFLSKSISNTRFLINTQFVAKMFPSFHRMKTLIPSRSNEKHFVAFLSFLKIIYIWKYFCPRVLIRTPIFETDFKGFNVQEGWYLSWTSDAHWSVFSLKFKTFGLGQTIWADKLWGIWGIFIINNTHFFHFSTIVSPKIKPLYPHRKY